MPEVSEKEAALSNRVPPSLFVQTVTAITPSNGAPIGPVISEADAYVDRVESIDGGSTDETATVTHGQPEGHLAIRPNHEYIQLYRNNE